MSDAERDIERLTEALARATTERDELDARLSELLYIVSHDLRAPLRHVKNLAEWATEDVGDTLAAVQGTELEISASGPDAKEALAALTNLVEQGFEIETSDSSAG